MQTKEKNRSNGSNNSCNINNSNNINIPEIVVPVTLFPGVNDGDSDGTEKTKKRASRKRQHSITATESGDTTHIDSTEFLSNMFPTVTATNSELTQLTMKPPKRKYTRRADKVKQAEAAAQQTKAIYSLKDIYEGLTQVYSNRKDFGSKTYGNNLR